MSHDSARFNIEDRVELYVDALKFLRHVDLTDEGLGSKGKTRSLNSFQLKIAQHIFSVYNLDDPECVKVTWLSELATSNRSGSIIYPESEDVTIDVTYKDVLTEYWITPEIEGKKMPVIKHTELRQAGSDYGDSTIDSVDLAAATDKIDSELEILSAHGYGDAEQVVLTEEFDALLLLMRAIKNDR